MEKQCFDYEPTFQVFFFTQPRQIFIQDQGLDQVFNLVISLVPYQ